MIVDGEPRPAGAVAIAAGPWSAELVPLPVSALWGVVVEFELPEAPRHVLEEAGIKVLTGGDGIPDVLFSAVTARGISSIGSTFMTERPDPEALAPRIVANATRFLPALAGARPRGLRACARPISADGRPYLGLRGRERRGRDRPRRVGNHARAGVGAAGGRSAAGAAGGDPAGAQRRNRIT